ncbi:MAG: hypothetical protein ACLU3I_00475 [Acutalibacteraceae bacterium]
MRKNHDCLQFQSVPRLRRCLERAFFSDNALSEFKTDIRRTVDAFVLEADLPGFKKDIHVDVARSTVSTVTAERHPSFVAKDEQNECVSRL